MEKKTETSKKTRRVRIPYDPSGDPYMEGRVIREDDELVVIYDEMYGECRVSKPCEILEID